MSAIGLKPGLQHVSTPPDPTFKAETANSVTTPLVRARRLEPIDRSRVDPQILQAADGMEAMFVDYMYKVMRQTVPKDELTADSPATEIYQGMLDSEVAQKAAKSKGLGLSDQIIAYLNSRSYTGVGGTGARMTPAGAAENYSKISREKDISMDEARSGQVQAE